MKRVSDGWHTVRGYRVYVEDGCIMRGVKRDINGGLVPAYPYKPAFEGGYDLCTGVKVSTFRRSGRYVML